MTYGAGPPDSAPGCSAGDCRPGRNIERPSLFRPLEPAAGRAGYSGSSRPGRRGLVQRPHSAWGAPGCLSSRWIPDQGNGPPVRSGVFPGCFQAPAGIRMPPEAVSSAEGQNRSPLKLPLRLRVSAPCVVGNHDPAFLRCTVLVPCTGPLWSVPPQ